LSDASARESLWAEQAQAWRDPTAVVGWREPPPTVDSSTLRARVRGSFWEALEALGLTLIVTREYENLLVAISARDGNPKLSYQVLPHPSGAVFDAAQAVLHVAATRNPNQIVTFAPLKNVLERRDLPAEMPEGHPLIPIRTRFVPGCLYMHDLAIIGGELHANAVGENAVVRISGDQPPERVWWPLAIEGPNGPDFTRNHLQLNSIAAGSDLGSSFFTASAERIGRWRPGQLRFLVDQRGVIFSGSTREPAVRGLTRPHSARLRGDQVWVANSGYGELGVGLDGRFESQLRLGGWTRGLCMAGDMAVVGTSRVIPRFSRYAPGLDADRTECGIHLVDLARAEVTGSLVWPAGNQIFAIEAVPCSVTDGFAQTSPRSARARATRLYYSFQA
jgi:uncharacterized protein (TIGR03032 family)